MGERTQVELYVHLVWGTFRRRPLISADLEADLFRVVTAKSLELHCVPCAIGGTEDHLHLLTRLHPSTPVARLVAEVKGASSHLVTHRLAPGFSLGLLKATIPTSIRITEQSTTHS